MVWGFFKALPSAFVQGTKAGGEVVAKASSLTRAAAAEEAAKIAEAGGKGVVPAGFERAQGTLAKWKENLAVAFHDLDPAKQEMLKTAGHIYAGAGAGILGANMMSG
jgi:hypothetical protein